MTEQRDGHDSMSIAILGGTGKEGTGLALRWALAGYPIIIGSRDAERAQSHATQLNSDIASVLISGMENSDAAAAADIVVLSVPYSAHRPTLETVADQLTGKILIDVTVPLQPPAIRTVHIPEGKSAALEAQAYLGENVSVVSAFQNVGWAKLQKPQVDVECDVLVSSDDAQAKARVLQLADAAGMRGVDAGPLVNSIAAESLTPILMYINKTYQVKGAGIRITGID
jgi:NADPH-dependent F420 reductase